MDFDSVLVLFDGLATVTRTEVSISLAHDDETFCHSVAARSQWVARKVMRTYGFLAFFCLDAPSLYALCAFGCSRLDQLFLFVCLCRVYATGFNFLFVVGSHYNNGVLNGFFFPKFKGDC